MDEVVYLGHILNKRPRSVTVISWLFIAAGCIGLVYHATELIEAGQLEFGLLLIIFIRLLAIFSGIFMLRGRNWARWLLLVWLAYHVVLSAFHSLPELIFHTLLLAVVSYFLFRPQAAAYFRGDAKN